MEKILIRKVSDWWGDYDCSSNRNMPKYLKWLSRDTQDPHTMSVYVDNYIKDWGFNDPSREKIGWLLESPQMNEGTIKYLIETKLVSMIASNKGWLRGHQNRLEGVEKLKDKVDLFGTGRPNQLNDKEDGLREYMFSVSIENDNSDGYFTEKLTDNFVMGTVPIYWGSRKIVEKYFDPTGVIFLEDDPNLSTLTIEKYQSMIPAIERNFKLAQELPISEDYFFEKYLKNML